MSEPRSGHVLLAPDKFKGSLTAAEVADALAAGLRAVRPDVPVRSLPVADGGDGTLDAALSAGFSRHLVRVSGPTGEPVEAAIAVHAQAAVVELAEASGLRRLPGGQLAPLTASSYGTGELIRAALDAECREIVLGLGGSACTDGGAGLAQALGARLLDAAGAELPPGGQALARLDRVDLSGWDPRLTQAQVVVASDVDNPLTGPKGAAAIYGPQKGVTPEQVGQLDAALRHWADVIAAETGRDVSAEPGAGAAGGVGFAALALLGASLRPGIELLMEVLGFADALPGARLVVTGEGALDEQTLHGKAPAGVASAAARAGIPVVAVAGRLALSPQQLQAGGFRRAYALSDLEPDLARSMQQADKLLERIGARIATDELGSAQDSGSRTGDGLAELNALPADEAQHRLLTCCAARGWARRVAVGRPYADLPALQEASDAAVRALDPADIDEALAAHPRIGERAQGTGTEARWSRQEQSGMTAADQELQAALHEGNLAYEQRFGRVFLIFATGRTGEEMLAALRERLGNDPETEQRVVAEELAKITGLRLERLVGG